MLYENDRKELIANLDQLHTTELGVERIKKNLALWDEDDVVSWCRNKIKAPHSEITRKGKNWYIIADDCKITVHAYRYTIITAHKMGINTIALSGFDE